MKATAGAAAIFISAGALMAAPGHADDQSYLRKLQDANIGQYIDAQTALQMGHWFCQQI